MDDLSLSITPSFINKTVLVNELCEILKKVNIIYFSNIIVNADGYASAFLSDNRFCSEYFGKKYYHVDEHTKIINTETNRHYDLWDFVNVVPEEQILYSSLYNHNIFHGITVIERSLNVTEYYHFASTVGNRSINQFYINNLEYLKMFILYFKDKILVDNNLRNTCEIRFKTDRTLRVNPSTKE